MEPPRRNLANAYIRKAYTLIEVLLVVGTLAALMALAMPEMFQRIGRARLPESAERFRALVRMTRAHAAFDGKRYRIRIPDERDDVESMGLFDDRQPIIEREDDPILEPEVYNLVTEPWAVGETFVGETIWCAEVRLGRPTFERIRRDNDVREELRELGFEDFEDQYPPVDIHVDGSSDWITFVITQAPRELDYLDLDDSEYPRVEVIVDGDTGQVWLQRPFYEDELDLFEENNWPIVLRQDFLRKEPLTENDVLELHESLYQHQQP